VPDNIEPKPTGVPPIIDSSGRIKTTEEIEASKRAEQYREESNYKQQLLDAETRQAKAQGTQATASLAIVFLTVGLIIVSIISGFVSYLQFQTANRNANTAENQAFVTALTVGQTQRMIGQAIAQTETARRSANAAVVAANAAKNAANTARASLLDARRSSELSMRPYIQITGVHWTTPFDTGEHAKVELTIQNSGKSPVIIKSRGQELGIYYGEYGGSWHVSPVARKLLEFRPMFSDINVAGEESKPIQLDHVLFLSADRIKDLKADQTWVQIQGTLPVYSVFLERDFEPIHYCLYFLYSLDKTKFWNCPADVWKP
jgi:hypothetical protein